MLIGSFECTLQLSLTCLYHTLIDNFLYSAVSILGVVCYFLQHLLNMFSPARCTDLPKQLSLREAEYLAHIRTRNMLVYGHLLELLWTKYHIQKVGMKITTAELVTAAIRVYFCKKFEKFNESSINVQGVSRPLSINILN